MNDLCMARYGAFVIAASVLVGSNGLAQTRAPSSINLCPVTHNCRPVGQGAQEKRIVAAPPPVGNISCPPGTYRIPNTNRCRVK